MDIHRLVELTLAADGTVDDRLVPAVLGRLTRTQLKEYLAGLRRKARTLRVEVAVSGEPGPDARSELERTFGGREIVVSRDEALGGGVKINAGDDVLDASVRGYLRATLEKLGKE
jgi:F0F1-type ATP synthase delta subunit